MSWFAIDEATAKAGEAGAQEVLFLSIRGNESEVPRPKHQIVRSRNKYVKTRDQYSSSEVIL